MSSQVLNVGSSDALSPQIQSHPGSSLRGLLSVWTLTESAIWCQKCRPGAFPTLGPAQRPFLPRGQGSCSSSPKGHWSSRFSLEAPTASAGTSVVLLVVLRGAWQGSAPCLGGNKCVPRNSHSTITMGFCLGPVDAGSGAGAAHPCRKWPWCLTRRGQSSQPLGLEPAASCFLILSCCFIINPVALQPARALACPMGWGAAPSLVKLRRAERPA